MEAAERGIVFIDEIDKIARKIKKDFSAVTNDLLEEAIRAHRCPGIVFSEGVSGKRAKIAGTGIEVWEIIAACRSELGQLDKAEEARLKIDQLRRKSPSQ